MNPVEQVLSEPSPATVNHRSCHRRQTLKNLVDNPKAISEGKVKRHTPANTAGKLSRVNGVFILVLLNSWGVIVFLRLG